MMKGTREMIKYLLLVSLLLAMLVTVVEPSFAAKVTLLNASYNVSREFYKNYNPLFIKFWKQKTTDDLTINQSHGGSSK